MHHLYIIYVLIPQSLRYLLAGLCIEYVMIKCLLHTQLLVFLRFYFSVLSNWMLKWFM